MTIENWTYGDFVKANDGKFSVLDFIHAISAKVALPDDYAVCMGRLFCPKMIRFDDVIVIAEWFDEAMFRDYRNKGMTAQDAQAWVNLVELTAVFQGMSFEKAKELAIFIVNSWNEQIRKDFPNEVARARVMTDAELDEVFITLGEFSANASTSS